ncbi:MAG: AAA family ATPase [Arcticibacter sp.]
MDHQFEYLKNLSTHFTSLSQNSSDLLSAVHKVSVDVHGQIFQEYVGPDAHFQPVNILRATIAREVISGETLTVQLVDEIKERVRQKDKKYFHFLPDHMIKEMEDYVVGSRDIFANWQKLWAIFHVFLFRGETKERTRRCLEELSEAFIDQLDINDYTFHWVDFCGPSNFGSTMAWLALYPAQKNSHMEAYQFFLGFNGQVEAGMTPGREVKDAESLELVPVSGFNEALTVLGGQKAHIVGLNRNLRNFFKFSPGAQASKWEQLHSAGIAALDFSGLDTGDLRQYRTHKELNVGAGLKEVDLSNQTWNLWLFKTAQKGDVVFANKGTNTCIGIGIIEGDYIYDENSSNFAHVRRVNWITDYVYLYVPDKIKGYKTLFRPDTFAPTKVSRFILNEYLLQFPQLEKVFRQHNLLAESVSSTPEIMQNEEILEMEEDAPEYSRPEPQAFWWLNANPTIWSLNDIQEGDRQVYTTYNAKKNKRRIYKYFEAAQPGDLVIGYESSPSKQIKGIFQISQGIHHREEGEVIEVELFEKLDFPVNWSELISVPSLQNCEVFINNQGSLFKLTETEFDIVRDIIDSKNIQQQERKLLSSESYSFADDPDKPFIPEEQFSGIIKLLRRKKNVILQGPPGVGKTFIAKKIAYEMMGAKDENQIEMVQFHQSYSYEDFIQGIRPGSKGDFKIKNGVFFEFCRLAEAHPERDYFFVIDEINRGNLSKIFGELLMLIEAEKRGVALKLTYAEDEHERFSVPDNLYLIGTMNTADRSLAIVDYALRRRFAFVELTPVFDGTFKSFLEQRGVSKELTSHLCASITRINNEIKNDPNLGKGFMIGHSYFCSYKNDHPAADWWADVCRYELEPLLEEIWFDQPEQVDKLAKSLQFAL